MSTKVQRRRGTTAEHSTFTGAAGELTVDTDKDAVVVHDGTTAGGHPMLRQDQANLPTSAPSNGVYLPSSNNVAISTNGTGRLFVDASGNVGVGTSSPVNVGNYNTIHLAGRNASTGGIFRSTSSDNSIIGLFFTDTNGVFAGTDTNHPYRFATNGSERMRLDSSGRLGLGSSSPGYQLHVASANTSSSGTIFASDSGGRGLLIQSPYIGNAVGKIGISGTDAAFAIGSGSSNTTAIYIDTSQRVGIGTTTVTGYQSNIVYLNGSTGAELHITTGGTGTAQSDGLSLYVRDSDGTAGLMMRENNALTFGTNDNERARIDSSGRLLVGTSSSIAAQYSGESKLQIAGTGIYNLSAFQYSNNAFENVVALGKSRGSSVGSHAAVQNGDGISTIRFEGSDGTGFITAAQISAAVDGTPGANNMPGRIVLSTTGPGASSPTSRLKILSTGSINIENSSFFTATTDNAVSNGASGYRWTAIWAATGTIQTSDQRAKTDVSDAQLGSDFIKSLRPVSYKWIEGGKRDTGERDENNNYIYEPAPGQRTHWGFIAQEVKEAVDAAGVDFGGWVLTDKDDPDSQQALRYDQFIAPLTKALQEALAEIDVLKAKVAALEAS